MRVMYAERMLLYIRTLTPLHVGVGRSYGVHVDLPVQRDEFGVPCVWSSSLKGAIKSWLSRGVQLCLGPDPDELEGATVRQSSVVFTDAKLVLIPARVISGVYAYVTSLHLLDGLNKYLEVAGGTAKPVDPRLKEKLNNGVALVSKGDILYKGRLLVNEVDVNAEVEKDLIQELGLSEVIPKEIFERVVDKGLALVPDANNLSNLLVNRSMVLQYRVRLSRDTKTVDVGPWSEEFVPAETVFVSLVLCRGSEIERPGGEGRLKCSRDVIRSSIDGAVIFVGGKETIGRGLAKLYSHVVG